MSALAMILHAIASAGRRLPSVLATSCLAIAIGAGSSSFAQEPTAPAPDPASAPSAQALTPQQIDQLVAPIALYPDNLLGQVLTASTYPLEVVMAARWSTANSKVTGPQLEEAMQMQPWDPSVKALTAVPQTLQMMNDKLDWTKELGEAYLAQPDDVATSVQRLRARADASGNLKPSNQVRIKHIPPPPPPADLAVGTPPPPPEYIAIEPVQPDVLFVPVYDPFLVYGVWPWPAYRPFYWYPPGFVSVGVFGWGAPLVVGAAIWSSYNWYSRRVDVDVVRFNRFNHTNLVNSPENRAWRHDPVHRGNIAYSNPKLREEFGRANANVNRGTNQQLLSKQGTGVGAGKGITSNATGNHIQKLNVNPGIGGNQNKGRENFSRSATINPGAKTGNNNNNIINNSKATNNFGGNTQNTNRNFNRNAGNNVNSGRNAPLGVSHGPGPGGGGGGGKGKNKGH
ncbi:MAG TPA: DUF3300 domain-containing protein [Xanthobacteraceae bacterium]